MARKKKHPEHVNHERWLVSYADFITLLFAFFVVMFAVSQVDSKKVGRFTESFSKAVGIDMFPQAGRGLMSGSSQGTIGEPEPSQGSPLPEELVNLKTALSTPDVRDDVRNVQILARRNELVLRLSDGFVFESGNDSVEERARRVIARLAAELRNRQLHIRVEGHTDDRPIHTARFRSNWDLSTARATAVVARLAAEGIAPERLSAAGYGEFHPLASNATDEGRKQNRRVDLVVSLPLTANETPEPPDPKKEADAGPAAPAHPKEHHP
jgi:chemotaxis protein MotB